MVADHFCESGGIEGGVGGDSEGGFCGRARGPGQLVIGDVREVSQEHLHGVDGISLGGLDDGHRCCFTLPEELACEMGPSPIEWLGNSHDLSHYILEI